MKKGLFIVLFAAVLTAPAWARTQHFDKVIDKAFDASGLSRVSIKAENLRVEGWDVDSVVVHAEYHVKRTGWFFSGSDSYDLEFQTSGSTLRISEVQEGTGTFGIMMNSTSRNRVVVRVPHSIAVDVKGDDCSLNLFDLRGPIRVEFDDGSLRAENITGPEFHIQFSDGSASLYQVETALNVEFDDGRFQLRESKLSRLKLHFSDGRADLEAGISGEGPYRVRFDDGHFDWTFAEGTEADVKVEIADGSLSTDFPGVKERFHDNDFYFPLGGG
ncbi:DUF4097 domain-containing protein, partial [bacterium]|nr:DUF4097 domain-containing protein [bacterium]